MNCLEIQETLSAMIDGEADDSASAALFLHLSACGECRRVLHTVVQMKEALRREMPSAGVPSSLDRRILQTFGARQEAARPAVRVGFRRKISLPVSAAILALILSIAAGAFVTSTYFPRHEIIEKQEQELVYIMELPQVEIKGQTIGGKHVR